jgi:preprotein translocase subunit SecF
MAYFSFSRVSLPFSLTKHAWLFFSALVMIVLLAFSLTMLKGPKWGIDFEGGVVLEMRFRDKPDMNQLRGVAEKRLGAHTTLQETSGTKESSVLLRTQEQKIFAPVIQQHFESALKNKVTIEKLDIVGAKLGKALMTSSLWALFFAILGIGFYVWMRFDWRFSIAGWASLLFDCAALMIFYVISRCEVSEGAVVAFLITLGYSINDTVIIFDRIRENRGYKKTLDWGSVIDLSVQETLSRTILTSVTTLLALGVLYGFGGAVIATYTLPMLMGIASGTVSSIFISVPILYLVADKRALQTV